MESTFSYKLESFEGPLDLLLQLIARNKLNINDIPLTELIDQYLEQIQLFKEEEMDIASEFLEMAARLIYIKTVSLLPKHDEIIQLKAELTGELLEYQLCQEMAGKLSLMTAGFDTFIRKPTEYEFDKTYKVNAVNIAFQSGTKRQAFFDLYKSNDGVNYEKFYEGTSSGKNDTGETFSFEPVEAKFIKFYSKGSSTGSYNTIIELGFLSEEE
jgi:hypothetical protein